MEKNLELCIEEMIQGEDITGVLLADKRGLCLAVSGSAKADSTGVISAIAHQISKLEPSSPAPVILLEGDTRKCLIQQSETLTTAIFKTGQPS